MKKTLLIILIVAITTILFVSCNADSTEGIFEYISETNENLNMKINSYLGKSDTDIYYYIENGDLKSYDGTSVTNMVSSSESSINRLGYYDGGNDLIYILNNNGILKTHNLTSHATTVLGNPEDIEDTDDTEGYTILTTNGYILFGNKRVYEVDDLTTPVTPVTPVFTTTGRIDSILVSGDDILIKFFADDKNKVCLVQNGTEPEEKNVLEMNVIGFQKLTDTMYLLIDDTDSGNNLYTWNWVSSPAIVTDTTLDITEVSDNSEIKSFASGDIAYFHLKPYFVKVDTSSDITKEEITDGFASNLRNEEIVNIIGNIAATVSNGLFEINLAENTSTNVFN